MFLNQKLRVLGLSEILGCNCFSFQHSLFDPNVTQMFTHTKCKHLNTMLGYYFTQFWIFFVYPKCPVFGSCFCLFFFTYTTRCLGNTSPVFPVVFIIFFLFVYLSTFPCLKINKYFKQFVSPWGICFTHYCI